MPYTNLIQNCLKVRLKANQFLSTMSTSLQFCPNRFHFETNPLLYRSSQSVIPQKRCLHGSVGFFCSAKGSSSSSSSVVLRRKRHGSSSSSSYPSPYFYQQNLGYGRFAYDECESESESDRETQSSKQLGESTLHNIEEWRWKLSMLMRKKDDQEVVSTDKKDRRDFEHISAMATRMGLHCRQYEKNNCV